MEKTKDYNIGDLLEVTTKDGRQYRCIVVENLEGGFVGKVVEKDKGVGTASWNRYDLHKDGRFQSFEECKEIKRKAVATVSTASSSFQLNESINNSQMKYYTTPVGDGSITFCICEGYGGWSDSDDPESLKESFFNSQISKINNRKDENTLLESIE